MRVHIDERTNSALEPTAAAFGRCVEASISEHVVSADIRWGGCGSARIR